ncbi:MAG: branched-chain amino acid ABC transporter permease [Lachnospiraceae bacterium]|jgi:branched-chain amino acid transport system permease protein|nr:branched-chain amino acid ABC transporter permease [Lachnospiraceae bacterium]
MESFLAYTINGLVLGSTYALTAIGYSMVYGILELVNFTHSTIYMVGAYLFYIFVTLLHIPMPLSFLLTILATGAVGALNERLTIRPLRAKNRPKFAMLICTIGTSIVLQNVFFLLMGSETKQYPTIAENQSILVLGFHVTVVQIVIVVSTVLLLAAFTFFINRTKLGMAMRACAQDTEATELMGVSVDQVVSMTFFIGSALAAVAGIMGCMSYRSVDCSIGAAIGTKTFASTVLGGIGVFLGGVLGGLIIGLTEVYTAAYIGSNYRNITAFIILILVLFLKPTGLLGKKVIKKV